jgi:predicted transcriptional regulator
MANKKQPLIIEPGAFRVYLAARMAALKLSVGDMAGLLAVSQATVYQLLAGTLSPSEEVLQRAGLRTVYVMDVDAEAEPPAKVKGKK